MLLFLSLTGIPSHIWPIISGKNATNRLLTTMTLTEGMRGMGPDIFISLGNISCTITADI